MNFDGALRIDDQEILEIWKNKKTLFFFFFCSFIFIQFQETIDLKPRPDRIYACARVDIDDVWILFGYPGMRVFMNVIETLCCQYVDPSLTQPFE